MLRRQEIAAWRPCGSKLLPCVLQRGSNQVDALANAVFQRFKESGAVQELMPGRDERRSQQAALPPPGGVNEVAPASRCGA